jgi:hypothetical protein
VSIFSDSPPVNDSPPALHHLHDPHLPRNGLPAPYPARDDRDTWADWWHAWAAIGRTAAALDPLGPIYAPEYLGDDKLPEVSPDDQEAA